MIRRLIRWLLDDGGERKVDVVFADPEEPPRPAYSTARTRNHAEQEIERHRRG